MRRLASQPASPWPPPPPLSSSLPLVINILVTVRDLIAKLMSSTDTRWPGFTVSHCQYTTARSRICKLTGRCCTFTPQWPSLLQTVTGGPRGPQWPSLLHQPVCPSLVTLGQQFNRQDQCGRALWCDPGCGEDVTVCHSYGNENPASVVLPFCGCGLMA